MASTSGKTVVEIKIDKTLKETFEQAVEINTKLSKTSDKLTFWESLLKGTADASLAKLLAELYVKIALPGATTIGKMTNPIIAIVGGGFFIKGRVEQTADERVKRLNEATAYAGTVIADRFKDASPEQIDTAAKALKDMWDKLEEEKGNRLQAQKERNVQFEQNLDGVSQYRIFFYVCDNHNSHMN